jgi:hypothetical protein
MNEPVLITLGVSSSGGGVLAGVCGVLVAWELAQLRQYVYYCTSNQ